MTREPEDLISPTHTVPVTTVRVTWLDAAGTPDHPWAVTYHFTNSVDLTLGHRIRTPAPDAPPFRLPSAERAAHLTTAYDHEERTAMAYLAQGLRRPGTPKCLEAWNELEDGTWAYILLPWWQAHPMRDDWPMKTKPGQELHAAGYLRQAGAHTWPPVCPLDEPRAVEPGVCVLAALTRVRPPGQGFPPLHPTARLARRPARTA